MTAAPTGPEDTDQGSTVADSGAPTSDRSKRAARTVGPVADHRSGRSIPAQPSCRHPFGCQAPGEGCYGPCPVSDAEAEEIEREAFGAAPTGPEPRTDAAVLAESLEQMRRGEGVVIACPDCAASVDRPGHEAGCARTNAAVGR